MNNPKATAPPAVQRYWNAISNMLRIDSEDIAGLINHLGTRGTADENSIIKVLSKVLPPTTRVSSGEVIDADGTNSAQMDALILSNTSHPILFAQTSDELIFPVESVLLSIEVKGALSKNDVTSDIPKKIRRHQQLVSPGQPRHYFAVFAHDATSHPKTVANWFFEMPQDARPDFFLVNNSSLFGILDPKSAEGYQIVMPFAPKPGERNSRPLAELGGVESGFWWPVDMPLGEHVRADHGRGMLLFVKAVLDVLSEKGYADVTWLERYLNKVSTNSIRYVEHSNPVMETS